MSGWLRRNRLPLIAAGGLALLTTVVVGGNEWWQVAQSDDLIPMTTAAGGTADVDGVRYGPVTASEVADPDGAGVPDGARLIVVEVPIDPGAGEASCPFATLHELEGAGRTWRNAPVDLDWYPDGPSLCGPDEPGPFTGTVGFLVPDDAAGPFGLDLTLANELPRFLRLVVAP